MWDGGLGDRRSVDCSASRLPTATRDLPARSPGGRDRAPTARATLSGSGRDRPDPGADALMETSAVPGWSRGDRAEQGDGVNGDDALAPPWGWFWAKTGAGGAYLPLLRHLEDVAAVARRLWDVALTDRQRAWFAAGFGLDETDTRRWISFLAASHDVGKANRCFQELVPSLAQRLLPKHLRAARQDRLPGHDTVSGAILLRWLTEQMGMSLPVAERLVATFSGHHSVPKARGQIRAGRRAPTQWRSVQDELADSLARRLGVDAIPQPKRLDAPTVLATAGLISVADWIASDPERFPVTDGPRRTSEELARDAVHPSSWAPRPRPDAKDPEEIFEFALRASQRAAAEAVAAVTGEKFLLLIEDRPGSGKTEAAFIAALQGFIDGCRGIYVGMPTQATANQLHDRAKGFLESIWPDQKAVPRLLHSGIDPHEDLPAPREVAADQRDRDEADERDAEAQAWFAQSRRGLLGPHAVGTVDQALLATLVARHYPVRMLGLQGKVVVLDEVHAYDAYTGYLLEALVEWLAALDCTVVLLSATLPPSRRRRLVAAYLKGCEDGEPAPVDEISSDAYPRITVASPRLGLTQIPVDDDRPGREVALSWEHVATEAEAPELADQAGAVAERALLEVEQGGCLAIVCSTVAEAQDIYVELRRRVESEPSPVQLELLHSRMRRLERGPIEKRLLSMLGPPDSSQSASARPERLIVVATQVIEQSLDIDFDVMFSFLAPVDLLIQRAGRVHRHVRPNRPVRHRRPRLVVIDAQGEDPLRKPPAGSAAVYVEAALVRTRLALLGRESLCEPDDLDPLIAAVYEEGSNPGRSTDERLRVERLDEKAVAEEFKQTAWAQHNALASPHGVTLPWERHGDLAQVPEDPRATAMNSAATRYSERPSLSLIPLFPDELPDSRRNPSADDVSELLKRAVPVSSRGITRAMLDAGATEGRGDGRPRNPFLPSRWMRNGRLRHHFLVELDESGVPLPVEREAEDTEIVLPFRLDRELGLVETGG